MNAHVEIDEVKADALIVPPSPETAMDAFKTPSGIDPYIALVRKYVSEFTPDVSTAKGRREIASIAAKVARSKTLLDDVGKTLVADLKELPKKIDATRKYCRDTLDQIKEDVRRPLTEWEDAEASRVAKHETNIRRLEELASGLATGRSVEWYEATIDEVMGYSPGDDGEDFADAYCRLLPKAVAALSALRDQKIQADAEAAELEALRREKAEREAKERAEAEVRAAAEREERMKREAAEAAMREAAAAAERERQAAQVREEALKREAEAAKRRAAEAEQRAKDEIARQQKAEADAAEARERDRVHRTKVNNAALAAFVTGGVPEDCAKQVVTLIAKGMIPNVLLRY